MAKFERGIPFVERVIALLSGPPSGRPHRVSGEPAGPIVGASEAALDAIESRLMVELPPTLRRFLAFDFTFASFGRRWQGRHRFGKNPALPQPRISSARKLAEARTELGWTDSRIKTKLIRLPNLPKKPWNAIHLGEANRDGELMILGVDNDETSVRVYKRYTGFDLYLADQLGLERLSESQRLEDLDSFLAINPDLVDDDEDEDHDADY